MASFDNYADLQATLSAWLGRTGNTTDVPADWIALFEEEARDRLKTRFNEVTTTLTTTGGQQTLALPSMCESVRLLVLNGSPNQVLTYVTPEEAAATWVDTGDAQDEDSPLAFTIEGTNLLLYPVPEAAQTITITYMQGLPALSNSNATNWLLQDYPSLYLTGSLLWGTMFTGNDERAPLWQTAKEAAFQRILQTDIKARFSGETLQIKTDTGNP